MTEKYAKNNVRWHVIRHCRLENGMNILLSMRHWNVWSTIGEGIIEISGVYNRSRKCIRGLTNEAQSQHILSTDNLISIIICHSNYQSFVYNHKF